jgi:hypothetical protein
MRNPNRRARPDIIDIDIEIARFRRFNELVKEEGFEDILGSRDPRILALIDRLDKELPFVRRKKPKQQEYRNGKRVYV